MDSDPQLREPGPTGVPTGERPDVGTSDSEINEVDLFQVSMEKARRLVAAELELADMRCRLLDNNLKITEAQLELAERQLDQLMGENERLRRENEALVRRMGEST